MAKYLKPQTPLQHQNGNYIYPLTTVDQVIIDKDNRLNSLFKKTIKETATLQVANWSDTKPYTQTIILNHSVDDYDVDANVAYGDGDNATLHAAAGCLSYIKKNNNTITFYCLKKKPDIDIPVEISGTCRNTIADITIEEGVKLNFDIVAYATEEELLADTPAENTIGVMTTTPITGYKFSATDPSINEINLLNDAEIFNEYCTSDGDIIIDNDSEYKLSDYIAVQHEKSYLWNYNISDTISANHYIVEFTSGNTFKQKTKTISGVSGTSFNGTYTPSSSDVVFVRIGWGIVTGTTIDVSFNEYDIVEGEVWIKTGNDSNVAFDVVDDIKIYPLDAKQYVSGAWVDKTAKSYQNGEWVDWATYLFKAGEGAKVEFVSNSESKAAVNITNDYIELTSSGGRSILNTKNKIITAGKSALVIDVILTEIRNSTYPLALVVTNKPYLVGQYDIATYTELKTTGSHVQTVQVPLDTLSGGEYYIAITGAVNAKIVNWYMR